MREHPLLLSGPQVLAAMSGLMTQIRKPLPNVFNSPPGLISGWIEPGKWKIFGLPVTDHWGAQWRGTYPSLLRCPFGKTGDRLWVRETFAFVTCEKEDEGAFYGRERGITSDHGEWFQVRYAADTKLIDWEPPTFRPSVHMPRWACRFVLPLISVRIYRLHDITEDEAMAEAVGLFIPDNSDEAQRAMEYANKGMPHKAAFCMKWQRQYGTWDINPWVAAAQWEKV